MKKQEIKKLIHRAKTIALTTHISPDPDGIGSMIALGLGLKSLNKNVNLILEAPLSQKLSYLDTQDLIKETSKTNLKRKYDLFIILDANSIHRIGEKTMRIQGNSNETLFIDHHPCPAEVMALHLIDTNFAATGELVADLLEYFKIKLTKEVALALYTAILIDTSNFNYPTMKSRTHHLIGRLIDAGVSPQEAFKKINSGRNLSFIHFIGKVLSRCKTEHKVVYTTISQKDLKDNNIQLEDSYGVINYLLNLEGAILATLFIELEISKTKISFRSFENIDVGVIAQLLGGGGHQYASAAIVKLNLQKAKRSTLKKLEIILSGLKIN